MDSCYTVDNHALFGRPGQSLRINDFKRFRSDNGVELFRLMF